ncbi:MAG: HAD-IA family hydrolase [Acidithiobacillus sp.]
MPEIRAVLFDLDGTLVDTAPDLAAAANRLRARHDLSPLPLELLRPVASQGARGLLGVAFAMTPDAPEYGPLRSEFLDLYAQHLCEETRLFPGMEKVLERLAALALPWGIVTNKPAFLTEPLLDALDLPQAPGVVVSGDTLTKSKPDPKPVRHAIAVLGVPAPHVLMIGDDRRDIQAGHGAGVRAWAAGWGYIEAEDAPERWAADRVIADSRGLEAALFPV